MSKTYRMVIILLVWLILFLFSGKVKGVDKGGTLTCFEKETPDSYDPITSKNMAGFRLTELMFESLLSEAYRGYEGRLAERWDFSNDSLTVVFHLKQNVKWCEIQDKEVVPTQPFTAEDVLHTYQVIKNEKTDTDPYNREQLKEIKEVKVMDPYTIEFKFKRKLIKPEECFTFKIIPKYGVKGGFITKADPFARSPVGTGWYVFSKAIGDNEIILNVNKAHYDEQANIDQIDIQYYSDETILSKTALLNRDIPAVIEIGIKDIAEYKSSGQYEIRRYAPLNFDYLGYNLKNKLFSDRRVRQALTYAIDKEKILREQFLDKGVVISGPYPPGSPLNNPDVTPLRYDTLMAKRLLREAGYREMGGEWISTDGSKLAFTLSVAAQQNDPAWSTAEHLKGYWKDIGIPVKLEKVTGPVWWQRIYQDRDFEVTYGRWRCDRASDITPLFKTNSEKNYVSYSNPLVDSLIRLLDNITIPEERRVINWKMHEILAKDCPYSFLWSLYRYAAISNKVRKSEMIHDFNFFSYINKWWIPEEWQK